MGGGAARRGVGRSKSMFLSCVGGLGIGTLAWEGDRWLAKSLDRWLASYLHSTRRGGGIETQVSRREAQIYKDRQRED